MDGREKSPRYKDIKGFFYAIYLHVFQRAEIHQDL